MHSFEKHVPELVSIIRKIGYRYINNQSDVEDLIQEVLLKLVASNEYIELDSIQAWTTVIARNTAIDSLRQKRRIRRYEDIHATARLNKLADSELPPFQIADRERDFDSKCELAIALNGLPPPQRSVLALHAAGYSYSEIAREQKICLGTVRSRIHYAKNKAQTLLVAEGRTSL